VLRVLSLRVILTLHLLTALRQGASKPVLEGTEFGQQAMARQTARAMDTANSITSSVREARNRAKLSLDLWLAGDSVSAGSIVGEDSYAYEKFVIKEAAMAAGPLATGKLGRLGSLGELRVADELVQAGAADALLGQTGFRAARKSGFAFETKLIREGEFSNIEVTSNNAFDAEGRVWNRDSLVAISPHN
jgi:hypothetical protein